MLGCEMVETMLAMIPQTKGWCSMYVRGLCFFIVTPGPTKPRQDPPFSNVYAINQLNILIMSFAKPRAVLKVGDGHTSRGSCRDRSYPLLASGDQ